MVQFEYSPFIFFFNKLLTLDLKKTYKANTESSCIPHTQITLLLASYINYYGTYFTANEQIVIHYC